MRFTITIDVNNAAFYADSGMFSPAAEVTAILRDTAARVDHEETSGTVRDGNGNTVGQFAFSEV